DPSKVQVTVLAGKILKDPPLPSLIVPFPLRNDPVCVKPLRSSDPPLKTNDPAANVSLLPSLTVPPLNVMSVDATIVALGPKVRFPAPLLVNLPEDPVDAIEPSKFVLIDWSIVTLA